MDTPQFSSFSGKLDISEPDDSLPSNNIYRERKKKSPLKKAVLGVGITGILVSLLGISSYMVMQNQETRTRAVNDHEYMVVTPAELRRNGKAQVSAILTKLDPKFRYRLVFNLTYSPNPDKPPEDDKHKIQDRKKTKRVSENKTHKFTFRVDDCHYTANLDIQLYFREEKRIWKPINAPGTVGNTKLSIPCPTLTTIFASPTSEEETNIQEETNQEDASSSAETETAVEPSPSPIEVIEDTLTDDSLSEPDSEAEVIEDLEDYTVLEQESAAAQNTTASSPNPEVSFSPSPTPGTPSDNNPSLSPSLSTSAITSQIQPTPSATPVNDVAQNITATPASSANSTKSTGGFGALINYTNEQQNSSNTNQPTSTPTPTPTTQNRSQITPSPSPTPQNSTANVSPTPTTTALAQKLTSPSETAGQSGQTTMPVSQKHPEAQKKTSNIGLIILGVAATLLTGLGIVLLL